MSLKNNDNPRKRKSAPVENNIDSAPFKFVVEGKAMYIHNSLLASISKPLDRLMNGYMSESFAGEAVLKNVDRATFARFCDWVYTKSYNPASPSFRIQSIDEDGDEDEDEDEEEELEVIAKPIYPRMIESPADYKASKNKPSLAIENNKARIKEKFSKFEYEKSRYFIYHSEVENNSKKGALRDYTEAFLSHARFYTFGETFDVMALQKMAADELHELLLAFKLYSRSIPEMFTLIEYVYEKTNKPSYGIEPLRCLMILFIGAHVDTFLEAPGFHHLLSKIPDLLEDFVLIVGKLLKSPSVKNN